jgi:Mrp family chromosome partitioning ATPase
VAGLAITLFGIQLRRDANDPQVLVAAARVVAARVSEQEASVQQRILADTGDARAANVGFSQPDSALVRWRTDGGDREGSLATIADFYDNLPRGRLVVIGEPGAGKTTLAIQMALDLARAWLAQCDANGSQIEQQVPVRLSLPGFGPRIGEMLGPRVGEVAAELVRDRLDEWIAEQVIPEGAGPCQPRGPWEL